MRLIRQTETSECGLACLAMVASYHGHHLDLADLRRRFLVSANGASLDQLMRCATTLNLSVRPLRVELKSLVHLKTPCILHWNLNHFVVLQRVRRDLAGRRFVTIFDPARGERTISLEAISQNFTGVAMELTPTAEFVAKDERRPLSIRHLAGRIVGLRAALVQTIILAIGLEVIVVCAPLFNQFVVDEVIISGDVELLTVLVMGFGLMLCIQTALGLARSWLLMRWNMDISFQWNTRVFSHLCRLPAGYFQKRHIGDIVSRFGSIGSIQSTLSSLFAESFLDCLMALLAFGMMMLYSPRLCVVVVAAVTAYALLRCFFYSPFREASQDRLQLAARENTYFLESVRAFIPIKLFGREAERCAHWQNLRQDVLNREVETQKLNILFRLSSTTIFGIQGLVLFYLGAEQVMQNALTIGMLMAFSSYAATFSGRMSTLVDLVINMKMLGMHAERLADIVMEPVEEDALVETDVGRLEGSITLRGVRFRYAESDPWLLDGIDLHISAGQSVAITGQSGCGKTTLCKILLGLIAPTEGEVLIDGVPLSRLGLSSYRRLVGTVMQDDTLLAGSILENISFFTPQIDQQRLEQCTRAASIHEDILALPMGYQTLVGDMGSTLSGGQKQRIFLARALYKCPKILALDEATSHLDIAHEREINHHLSSIQMTRIVIAHKLETLRSVQRVFSIDARKIKELKL